MLTVPLYVASVAHGLSDVVAMAYPVLQIPGNGEVISNINCIH
jgi:hypothetical protein